MIQVALGIVLAFTLMLLLSRWKLWIGVFAASLVFGLMNYPFNRFLALTWETISSVRNWYLILGVGLIPVLGTILQESVHLSEILDRLKKRKKLYLVTTPLLFGLLPIPGGALLSCPLLNGVDKKITAHRYVVINLWFRHLLVIVYPLSSSLIIGAQLAGISIIQAVLSMIPVMLLMFVVGYVFLLKGIKNDRNDLSSDAKGHTPKTTICTLLLFFAAPFMHILLSTTVLSNHEQLAFFLAMVFSVFIVLISNRVRVSHLTGLFRKSKFDQFSLLFLFLLLFLTMVKNYENFDLLFRNFNPPILVAGFIALILTFISGRIEIALSIIYPFIFTVYEITSFTPLLFMFIYFSLFTGYLISPLHPCMAFTIEYFKTSYKEVFRLITPLLLIPFVSVVLLFLLGK